ncbi:zf-HC2 domain-containing protein [candidate division WOR-3 bacterium]|nr:zf-HC2 domain-containing protein [candidate division WOR-3 bacterium]
MNCKEIEKLLQLYHDGELEPEQRKEIECHLSGCPACQAKLAEFSALDELIRDGEAEKVPDPGKHYWHSFSMRLTRKLVSRRPSRLRIPARTKPFRFWLIPYLSAGAAIILVLIVSLPFLRDVPTTFSEKEVLSEAAEMEEAPGVTVLDSKQAAEEGTVGRTSEIHFGEALELRSVIPESGEDKEEAEDAVLSLPRADTDVKPTSGMGAAEEGGGGEIEAGGLQERQAKEEPSEAVDDGETKGLKDRAGFFTRPSNTEKALDESMRFQTPFSPPPGTLKVVVDSVGKLVEVTIKNSCGNPQADTAAINAYIYQWQGQTFRQRRAMLLVPFEETDTNVESND